ncbi:MAG TPA: hypothetical protein VMC84_00390 [Methanocella sp.]|uniref:hypothetical protein n=1 Tax=Methanocella sp. TaxID=2052833 RepID=UPI002C2DA0EF|nr:hypothetical protein [Methanocella sp.]HTY89614.1 hypothetical protein [Methanocella sp.]
MPAKKTITKTTKTPATKKKPVKKAPAKKVASKKMAQPVDTMKVSIQPRELIEIKALERGETIEGLISERKVELKPVEEYMGLQQKVDFHNKPVIPGLFDLIIPPGTPRKLILKLAKEYPIQLVRRDDIYVPVGVCDIERDLLAIRGDKKTIQKMEKVLFQEIEAYINGQDARRHDYSKPVRLEGVSPVEKKPLKVKTNAKVKAKAKK